MSSARPPAPARDTGLPPGVQVGPLGRRFGAYVIDAVVPAVAGLLVNLGARDGGDGTNVPLVVVGVVLGLAWGVVCWQQLATVAASPGMRLLKLQLVGFFDGRPVGWGRVLLRWLVWTVLSATGVGLLLVLGSLLVSPRHQGWHDRAAKAVVIVERPLAPRAGKARTARPATPPAAAAAPAVDPASDGRPVPNAQFPVGPPRSAGVRPVPATAPAVAGDPAIGPELAPLAGEPDPSGEPSPAEDGRTVVAGARRTILDGWVAELDDGREIVVRGLVLLGRNPQPEDGETDAQLVKLPDESRTVSKTHLALGVDDAGLFVVDRGSTNGSTITPPGQPTVPVGPFHAVPVTEGSVVSIGDHWVRIRRDAR
ncbi:hypothetical protein GCM10022197_19850 [Microlunatus spumicola]|uniref:FHA domain-containing protein n=1 Tax=Microlunatus spumicola TaxID=81499 RepID=A0ABP6XCU0_9ACTN